MINYTKWNDFLRSEELNNSNFSSYYLGKKASKDLIFSEKEASFILTEVLRDLLEKNSIHINGNEALASYRTKVKDYKQFKIVAKSNGLKSDFFDEHYYRLYYKEKIISEYKCSNFFLYLLQNSTMQYRDRITSVCAVNHPLSIIDSLLENK